MSIRYVDPEDHKKMQDMAWEAIKVVSDRLQTREEDLFVERSKVEILEKTIAKERANKSIQKLERVSDTDFGAKLVEKMQQVMAPMTEQVQNRLRQARVDAWAKKITE